MLYRRHASEGMACQMGRRLGFPRGHRHDTIWHVLFLKAQQRGPQIRAADNAVSDDLSHRCLLRLSFIVIYHIRRLLAAQISFKVYFQYAFSVKDFLKW
jgi:hypothetical protein